MESWRKFKKLGQGSFGTVYLARSASSFAAVKTARWEHSSSLRQEAEILTDLEGIPFVVQCYGEDCSFEQEEQGMVYNLFMEYAPGGTLDDVIRSHNGTMPESLVAYYSYMLLRGISGIHRKDLVHCDIKPSNVLVFKDKYGSDHLKLADFGLAKYEREEETASFRGTQLYASPESKRYGVHRKATDIWSFGCTVMEMMLHGRTTGDKDGICTKDLLDVVVDQTPPVIPRECVSELGRDFLRKCFQMYAEKRWTADMLLNHPFIKENTKWVMFAPPGFENADLIRWTSTMGLFSSRSVAPAQQQHEQCENLGFGGAALGNNVLAV